MINKDAGAKIRTLVEKYGNEHETLVYEALKEGILDELLDIIYKSGASINTDIVINQLFKYYKDSISKENKKQFACTLTYLTNKYANHIAKVFTNIER